MLNKLIPRDEQIFDMFDEIARRMSVAAKLLKQLFAESGRMAEHVAAIKNVGRILRRDRRRLSILLATKFGIPVSTTHTITGAIVGVGATLRLSAVRWGTAGRIVWAWILTIPAAALMAALSYYALRATIAP